MATTAESHHAPKPRIQFWSFAAHSANCRPPCFTRGRCPRRSLPGGGRATSPHGLVELDVRPGGRWRTCMISADGVEHWASGVYVEVVQDQRLEFTWAWETDGVRGHETSVVIEFTPCSDGTELQLTHQVFESLESRDAHSGGWSSCLDSLGDTLSELA